MPRTRKQTGSAQAPIENEHQRQHGQQHRNAADDVSQIVRQKRLGLRRCAVQTVAQQTRGVGIEKAERCLHQMRHALLANVGGRAEGGEVRAHQCGEIDHNPRHGKGEGHPTVARNARRLRPVRCDGYQIPRHQPDADIRQHAQNHGDGRKPESQEGQPFIAARVTQQNGYVALFLFFHYGYPSLCKQRRPCARLIPLWLDCANC